jgi:hypothetical protein
MRDAAVLWPLRMTGEVVRRKIMRYFKLAREPV